jgi:hypothetical protein
VRGIWRLRPLIALSMRWKLSLMALSGRPTIKYILPFGVQLTSIEIVIASIPYTALPNVFTIMG